jgi:hypothetical protein
MGTELAHLPANATLTELTHLIRTKERAGFELITLARGQISGQTVNLATFRALPFGSDPGPLTLITITESGTLDQQDEILVASAQGQRRLVSYAGTFVQGTETNLAAYRG